MGRDDDRKTDRQLIEEIADRARRTETRITKVAYHLGVDAGGERPEYDSETRTLYLPSRKTSIDDILIAIGAGRGPVSIYCGNDYLAAISTQLDTARLRDTS